MFFRNKIYENGKLINTIESENKDVIIKELINYFYFYQEKPEKLILNSKEYLTVKHFFSHKYGDGTIKNYLYDVIFSFEGLEGVNL